MWNGKLMITYNALLVGHNLQTSAITYGAVEINSHIGVPANNTKDILEIIKLANSHPQKDAHIEYLDMYGYEYNGERVLWEVGGTEEDIFEG
jgi:hypothetical protein